jgi:hypothetical protein
LPIAACKDFTVGERRLLVHNTSGSASIDPTEITNLQNAFRTNPNDLGVGIYDPSTGEIHLGSFDQLNQAGFGQGHQALADSLGITDTSQWQGFVIDSNGGFAPSSHFNPPFGNGLAMPPADATQVLQALQQASLAN